MQKNLSQSERYIGGIHRNVKANLVAGAIIVLVMIIVHLMSGCEPVLPEISGDKAKSLENDTANIDNTHICNPDINDWDKDTTIYKTNATPQ